jgi:hypothetical protein
MKIQTVMVLLSCTMLTSCVHQGYFLSPFQANNHAYKSLPMISDSVAGATYASGNISLGGANQNLRDGVFTIQGSLHRAHSFRHLQFHYGANLVAGNYHVKQNYDYDGRGGGNPATIFDQPGNRFFGGAGAFGGVNLVIPFRSGSEWRVIGAETNYQREFGDYGRFRRKLPDSAANVITRDRYFQTVGLTTNVIKKFRKSGNTFGYKFGFYVGTSRSRRLDSYYGTHILPVYISNTLHLTRQRVTGFAQINAGTFALNFQTGVNVRL